MSFHSLKSSSRDESSFTLIELLIVIAIIGILAATVVLVLNPTQLLAQSRDSTRIQDLANINTAISDYLADGNMSLGVPDTVYVSIPDPTLTGNQTSTCASLGLPALPTGWSYQCVSQTNLTKTNGTGWVPINFQNMDTNSPIPVLPIDPVNSTTTGEYFTYVDSGTSFEIDAMFESSKNLNLEESDGGDDGYLYEVGNNLTLTPSIPRGSVAQLNPADIKILVIEDNVCGSPSTVLIPDLNSLGFTDVIISTSTNTVTGAQLYSPNIIISFTGGCATHEASFLNQLYTDGYNIWTEGNDNNNSIYPISSYYTSTTCAGSIGIASANPIDNYWTNTGNSGCDIRSVVTAANPKAIVLGKDFSLNSDEIIYLEESDKGKWLDTQPDPFPNGQLLKNAIFYMMR